MNYGKKLLKAVTLGAAALALVGLSSCGSSNATVDNDSEMIVSVRDQSMLLVKGGKATKIYPISTSKFGIGSDPGSNRTPLGKLEIAQKIGGNARPGTVFKGRRPTGEVLKPNTPGRDPIVTRILWLRGKEANNSNTFRRLIYIHGTPEEKNIGRPASYGCIRMKSNDVMDLYRRVGVGADVKIIRGSLDRTPEGRKYYAKYGRPAHTKYLSLKYN
ncbi:L,D-transpeptidase [Roseibacillus persicicus]|uniref:L,D-transpeptidase n=1 Tax=Roseibacillus persicicus TaxID=454148 RepID=UPI00280CEC93|nr:L,D-transpeptidase [Roseibacillus persicicus]MDQ8189624.1 L,D-transpeptidase [Roseibacillus persicicus]